LLDHDDALISAMRRNHIAVRALAFFGKPLHERRGIGNFAPAFGQRLSLFERHEHRQIFLVGHHQLEPCLQNRRALFCGACTPVVQCISRCFDCATRFLRSHVRNAADDLPIGRVDHVFGLTLLAIFPAPSDECLLFQQAHIVKGQYGLTRGRHKHSPEIGTHELRGGRTPLAPRRD
jgi:hypothetical protein